MGRRVWRECGSGHWRGAWLIAKGDGPTMRVAELREVLRHYDADILREIAAELYKLVPKDKKT